MRLVELSQALALAGALVLASPPARAQLSEAPHEEAEHDDPAEPHGADPHAGHSHGGAAVPGMFNPPPDLVDEDPTLPAGTITITVLDADDKPMPQVPVTVGMVRSSIAKGESRSRSVKNTDDKGFLRLDDQASGSGVAFRVSVVRDKATFAATPFNMPATRGVRVRLHVYPVTSSQDAAMVLLQAVVYAELKDDRVQLQTSLQLFNVGKTAWVPDNVMVTLPEGFTAVRGGESMTDQGVDSIDKKGARLRGTFPPGRSNVDFSWQLPYSDSDHEIVFDMGLPPRVAVVRVIAQASQQMTLSVPDFPPPESQNDREGQRLLITEKQLRRDEAPLSSLRVTLGNLPTQGPGRYVASGLTALAVLGGLGLAFSPGARVRGKPEEESEQRKLLAELEELERLHRAGDVGPKTYERARRELIDALARCLTKPVS